MAAIKIGKYYITKNDPRFLLRKVAELTDENQKLKEMQCTFQGTGCQRKMKKYKEVFEKIKSLLNDYELQGNEIIKLYCEEIKSCLKEVE